MSEAHFAAWGSAPRDRRRGGTVVPVALLLAFSLFGALAAGLTPREGQAQLAIIGAPWKRLDDMAALVAAADGRIVEAAGLPNVIFARSDRPDFAAALYRAGAWLVLDPALLRGCVGGTR